VRENRSPGSVRGALGNRRSYRDPVSLAKAALQQLPGPMRPGQHKAPPVTGPLTQPIVIEV